MEYDQTADRIKAAATHVMAQLTPSDVEYASSVERGEHRGFSALHDLLDANMLLPQDIIDEAARGNCDGANAVIELVNDILTGGTS